MKKILCLTLSVIMVFGMVTSVSAIDYNNDVDVEVGDLLSGELPDENLSYDNVVVSLESGTDAGTFGKDGYYYTAYPYKGNEFLGWYNNDTGRIYSTKITDKLPDGNYTAKFKDNNVAVGNGGYELYTNGQKIIPSVWKTSVNEGWEWIGATVNQKKTGNKSLNLSTTLQRDIYTEFTDLEKNTYYIVSYSWMFTHSAITDTNTSGDTYYGSAIGTTAATTIAEAYGEAIGGDYTGVKNQNYIGGQWNDVEYVFYTGDETNYKMFFYFCTTSKSDKYEASPNKIYIDELTVYKPADQESVATYKATVSAENGYAYSLTTGPVKTGSEVTVVATPYGGYTFDGWYEDGVKVSSDKIYTFNITANRKLVAKCYPTILENAEYSPDVNSDGNVNLDDVVLLAQLIAGWDVEVNDAATDVNGDGNVNLDDVVLLAQFVAGWDVEDMFNTGTVGGSVLPDEDLTDPTLRETLLAGNSKYYNESTIVNEGNMARIAKVLKKAQNGEDITLVAFGGSITAGAAATTEANRYCNKVAAWFENKFNINVNLVNAGIGSTTSMLGVHRMDTDVLAHDPDLVLVDFTTNDGDYDPKYQIPYENLIRRLLEHETEPAVMAVFFGDVTSYSATDAPGKNVREDNATSLHLPSLIYYDIPTIDYYGQIWRYINAGVIKWTDVGGDEIHPSNNGHNMTASAINYYLEKVLGKLASIDTTTMPELPEEYLFGSDAYMNATFLSPTNTTPVSMTNMKVTKVHGGIQGWVSNDDTGGSITFEAKQITALTIFLQNKVGNAIVNIKVNGVDVAKGVGTNSTSTGFIWYGYHAIYDEPVDITLTISSTGSFGTGPIGVSY